MKATNVRVNVGVTKNMGNYESLRIDYELEVAVESHEDPLVLIDVVRNSLSDKITHDLEQSDGGRNWLRK